MKKMYQIYVVFTIISILMTCQARAMKSDFTKGIVISQFDKVEQMKALSVIGKLEVKDDKLFLVSKKGEQLASFPIREGLRISIEDINDENTGVRDIANSNVRVRFSTREDIIHIDGLNHFTTAHIYSLNGQQQMVIPLESNKTQQVDVSSLKKGIYILQIDTQVFKLLKK